MKNINVEAPFISLARRILKLRKENQINDENAVLPQQVKEIENYIVSYKFERYYELVNFFKRRKREIILSEITITRYENTPLIDRDAAVLIELVEL